MCKVGSNTNGTYETPLIDRGRWQASLFYFRFECEQVSPNPGLRLQIQLVFNDPQFVELNFFAKQSPDEILDPAGNRKGTFEITVTVSEPRLAVLLRFPLPIVESRFPL